MDVQDVYLGFNLWTILSGQYELKAIAVGNGYLKVVEEADGSINVLNVLGKSEVDTEQQTPNTEIAAPLSSIQLVSRPLPQ